MAELRELNSIREEKSGEPSGRKTSSNAPSDNGGQNAVKARRGAETGGEPLKLVEDSEHFAGLKLWRLVLDLPGEKVNKLGRPMLEAFDEVISRLEALANDGQVEAVAVVSAKPGNFIAGADIELIQSAKTAEEGTTLSATGQALLNRWEDLPFVKVALINGAALGGGLELSLACTALVVSDDPSVRVGLPEVNLGVIPGMGGCVRLPRKVGLATALDLILTGKMLNGERAYKAGLADALIPKQSFEEYALKWIKTHYEALKEGRRLGKEPKLGGMGGAVGTVMEKTPFGRAVMLKKAREGVMSKTRGKYPAPLEAIQVLHDTHGSYGERVRGSERAAAMAREAEGFGECAATEVSKNLIRLFFLTETVKKSKGVTGANAKPHAVRAAGVLGAGVMGGGIAQLFAEKNLHTRMKDLNAKTLAAGTAQAAKIFQKQVQKKKINRRQYLQKIALISPVTDYSGFRGLNFVVEAIVENMDVKKKVLRELEDQVGDHCIVASNTSSLSISEMQTALKNPERFAGMHFFNPVAKMPLVEVIRGAKSSDEAVSTVYQLSKALGKTPIVVKDAPGFLVNRLLGPYMNEASYLVAEGVPIPEVDHALVEFGMPMGPMELIDEVGIDVADKVSHIFEKAFGERMRAAPNSGKVIESGRLGKKNGKGMYAYVDEGKGRLRKEFSDEIYSVLGVTPKPGKLSEEEIVDRCVLPMINEAARCLEEGVVASASEVDLGMIMGTGFPPFRGGLLRYADSLGAREVLERLKKYHAQFGARFEPSAAMVKRAESGQTFHVES